MLSVRWENFITQLSLGNNLNILFHCMNKAWKKFLFLLAARNLIRRKQQLMKQKILRLILICYHVMRTRRKKLQQLISTSYLVSLKEIKAHWSTNRNETWFTELWEKHNDKNFRESFKEDLRIYPNNCKFSWREHFEIRHKILRSNPSVTLEVQIVWKISVF